MREFEAAVIRRNDEADRDTTLAWRVVSLVWRQQLPSLESLLITKPTQTPRQDAYEEQRRVLRQFAEYYRIPLREVTH